MLRAIGLLLVLALQVFAQGPPPAPKVFTESSLGFTYTPPTGMRDLTAAYRQSTQQRAAQAGTANVMQVLLALRSGPDDTASDWHSVNLQAYPRNKIAAANDHEASLKFSLAVVGRSARMDEPPVEFHAGGFDFVDTSFQLREGQLTKHARVFTTVMDGELVSFALSANNSDVLQKMTESMKSVAPLPKK